MTREDIASFEKEFGLKLPSAYREFLQWHNGGVPDSVYYGENGADIVLNEFLPLKYSDLSVEWYIEDTWDAHPNMIPFAEDAFGNLLLLSIEYEDVYFLDHETGGAIPLRTSFSDFLNKLTNNPPLD